MNFLLAFSVIVKTDGSFAALVIVLFPSAFSYHLLLRFTSLQSRGVAATALWGCHAWQAWAAAGYKTFCLFCSFFLLNQTKRLWPPQLNQVNSSCDSFIPLCSTPLTPHYRQLCPPWAGGDTVTRSLSGTQHWHSAPCNFKQAQNMVAGNFKLERRRSCFKFILIQGSKRRCQSVSECESVIPFYIFK